MKSNLFIAVSIVIILSIIAMYKNTESYKSFSSKDAHQGVAIDGNHIYVINNKSISKHDKETYNLVDRWVASESSAIKHLNGGRVNGDKLICTNSLKNSNTIEIFKTSSMEHIKSIPIDADGYLTWTYVDEYTDNLYGIIAHYKYNMDKSRLVRFDDTDDDYKIVRKWRLPQELLDRIRPWSLSGGFIYNGFIYCTTHDKPEIYKLKIDGKKLDQVSIIPINSRGQGIDYDWDSKELYSINRNEKKVIISNFDQ